MPSKSPVTSLLFKPGDRVKLKTHVQMPDHRKGETGVVHSIETDSMYPVNVRFDKGDMELAPCWDHELELIAESPASSEPANQG